MAGAGRDAGAVLALGGGLWAAHGPWRRAAPVDREAATFVGRRTCVSCHPQQDTLWRGSDHDLAMQVADEPSVLGNFGGATFTHRGVTSRFFRRDGKFFANTEGPDGHAAARYAYVYGVALHSTGRTAPALAVLTRAHDRHPGDVDVLVALSTIDRDRGNRDAARAYARKLLEVAPEDPRTRQLLGELDRGR